ncbi:hypothetical protein PYCCODRAFT_1362416 [Trametes coccinea BRFM310]|uniref:Uncharacterized protein n=1 Tax=Trametes coccinea (strain BRFM310) TaxID=1353009 RepID=A0A1Y2IW21_TRAC3|nr:hypothetical protein PYCCODRAFT_1362416 [Trametes coccinea BRFM310]
MHHISLNLGDLLIPLLRGSFRCDRTDDVNLWDWACLRPEDTWRAHGDLVAAAGCCLPTSFGCFPRNPAEKINSGYKAWEYQYYLFGLLPGLLWPLWNPVYHKHFCKLVSGVRTALLLVIPADERRIAHTRLLEYVHEFETLYYQRRVDRMHFVRQSIHALVHLIPEQRRVGPGALHSQWTMENYIGNLTREIGSDKEPYANLAERATRRACVNVLKAMFPCFSEDEESLPRGGICLGDGYALLRASDRVARPVAHLDADALVEYLTSLGVAVADWIPAVWKWARLRLPNGQIARTLWKEGERERASNNVRRARMVKVCTTICLVTLRDGTFAEVQYFFRLRLPDDEVCTLAMLAPFSPPDPAIFAETLGVLTVCHYEGDMRRAVVNVKDIVGVVGMVPFPERPGNEDQPARHFVVEKLSIDNSWIGRGDCLDERDGYGDEEGEEGN